MSAIQLRIDGAEGYGLPLAPMALAELSEFERGHIYSTLELHADQRACAEAAVALICQGAYPHDATGEEVAP
jgi:hypothetical protein